MSFPTITNPLTAVPTISQPTVLVEGQMIHGKIKQLYPGQTAEIQVGNQTMVAKLEVPLKTGDAYYFQVASVKPEMQLKIIAGPTNAEAGKAETLGKLMDAMQLPKTPEMQQILQHVVTNKLPMSRDQLLQAEQLLKQTPIELRSATLQAMSRLVELKLPLTSSLLQAVIGVQTKAGFHQPLTEFQEILAQDVSLSTEQKQAIQRNLQSLQQPLAQAVGHSLTHQLLQVIQQSSVPADRFTFLQLLKAAQVVPPTVSLANMQQQLTQAMQQIPKEQQTPLIQLMNGLQATSNHSLPDLFIQPLKTAIQNDASLSLMQKQQLQQLVTEAVKKPSIVTTQAVVTAMREAIVQTSVQQALTQPSVPTALTTALTMTDHAMMQVTKLAEQSSHPIVQQLLQQAEQAIASSLDGKGMSNVLKTTLQALGANYEALLGSKESDVGRLMDSLKPQLQALIQDPITSSALRAQAELLVARMNGPALTSGEQGLQHQLVMQVPLEFFGKKMDATLQWTGRMKENEQIDPDYARVLFYLDLSELNQTVVDMQVQNKVVSVTIFNEKPGLKQLGDPLQNRLRVGLEEKGYRLSGVFFKPFKEEAIVKKVPSKGTTKQGVDFRV